MQDMVVGGTETSSNTIEFAMAEMLNKPETIKEAQKELERVVGRDNEVEESHLPHLHYLNTIIKEVLRLHPALPLLVPHCPSSPSAVGGFAVPKGSRVFINVWAIHRDETLWKDPLEFKPERWNCGGDAAEGEFCYLPFGSGRRICAGILMAERMVSYALASLLHYFDWELPHGALGIDVSEKFGIVLKKAEPLVVKPVLRVSNLELFC
ncbi:geraniol 8-hydroxylase-like [Phalaenopsis equestris]|uniref:geraniol 8-hydroxylase-like n=1 Tax=Phalaenopsis equestris TaxID=78828 RepID=UPI0009E31D5D|nr:geraniol 8-hydroxylase-like [Phalaenopsis equestris]